MSSIKPEFELLRFDELCKSGLKRVLLNNLHGCGVQHKALPKSAISIIEHVLPFTHAPEYEFVANHEPQVTAEI